MTYRDQLREAKRRIVVKELEESRTVSGAARRLQIGRASLHRLMQQLKVPSPNPAHYGR